MMVLQQVHLFNLHDVAAFEDKSRYPSFVVQLEDIGNDAFSYSESETAQTSLTRIPVGAGQDAMLAEIVDPGNSATVNRDTINTDLEALTCEKLGRLGSEEQRVRDVMKSLARISTPPDASDEERRQIYDHYWKRYSSQKIRRDFVLATLLDLGTCPNL